MLIMYPKGLRLSQKAIGSAYVFFFMRMTNI